MKRALSIALLAILLFSSVLVLSTPVRADASDTHYLVSLAALCTKTNLATDADCWSHTSGGAGGAGVPGIGNAVIIDANSGNAFTRQNAAMSMASLTIAAGVDVGFSWDMNGFDLTIAGAMNIIGSPNYFGMAGGGAKLTVGTDLVCNNAVLGTDGNEIEFTGGGNVDCTNGAIGFISDAGIRNQLSDMNLRRLDILGGTWNTNNWDLNVNFQNPVTPPNPGEIFVDVGATFNAGTSDLTFWFLFIDGTMTMDGNTITLFQMDVFETGGFPAENILITSWVAFVTTPGSEFIRWNFNPNTAGSLITVTVGSLVANKQYNLVRDNVVIGTAAANGAGTWTISVAGGWSPHLMGISPLSSGSPPPPPPTPPPIPPGGSAVIVNCLIVTITDTRPEAVNGILWSWDFGDKSPLTLTYTSTAIHTYEKEGTYTVLLTVQDKSGGLVQYSIEITVGGLSCLTIGPYKPVVTALSAGILVVGVLGYLTSKRPLFRRMVIAGVILVFVVLIL